MAFEKKNLFQLLGAAVSGDLGDLTMYTDRRGRTVTFKKSPPTKPPSPLQFTQRARFRFGVAQWHQLSEAERFKWLLLTNRNNIPLGPLNLYLHFALKDDQAALNSLMEHGGVVVDNPFLEPRQ